MKTTITIVAVLLAGCAVDPADEYETQTSQIEAREAYAIGKELCQSRGGTMVIRTNRGSRLGEPDYHRAGCSSR